MDAEKRFTIRAYCGTCGKLLLESNPTSKKKLKEFWDDAVMQAPLCIFCKDCHPDAKINFDIEFKIYDHLKNVEHTVDHYFKSKIKSEEYDAFLKRMNMENAVNTNGELTQKEKFAMTLNMRKTYNNSLGEK